MVSHREFLSNCCCDAQTLAVLLMCGVVFFRLDFKLKHAFVSVFQMFSVFVIGKLEGLPHKAYQYLLKLFKTIKISNLKKGFLFRSNHEYFFKMQFYKMYLMSTFNNFLDGICSRFIHLQTSIRGE